MSNLDIFGLPILFGADARNALNAQHAMNMHGASLLAMQNAYSSGMGTNQQSILGLLNAWPPVRSESRAQLDARFADFKQRLAAALQRRGMEV